MVEYACRKCHRLVKGNVCPVCKSSDLTRSWSGIVIVFDPEKSEIAKEIGITSVGRFAVRVK